jgi:DNA-binding transcriptional ArsR family regulator
MPDITSGFHGGNAESTEANAYVEEHKPTMRRRIAAYVRRCGGYGATADEIEVALGMSHQTVSARLTELKQINAVYPSGARRPTRSGTNAAVLVAAGDPCPHGPSCLDCL